MDYMKVQEIKEQEMEHKLQGEGENRYHTVFFPTLLCLLQ